MPGLALAPSSYHLCTMGQLAMTSPLFLDLHSYLPVSMIISTSKKATSMCCYFQGGPCLSCVALLTTGHCGHYISQTSFGCECPKPSLTTGLCPDLQRPVQRLDLSQPTSTSPFQKSQLYLWPLLYKYLELSLLLEHNSRLRSTCLGASSSSQSHV